MTMIAAAHAIHAAAEEIAAVVVDTVDGLAIRKDMLKQLNADGATGN